MKKKIIFAIATSFFAVATVFNMNILQANSDGDVSLDAIAVMAQAQSEHDEPPCNRLCEYWPGYYCVLEASDRYVFCFDKLPKL